MAHLDLQSGTYRAAETLLGSRYSRKIGHNTVLIRRGESAIAVRYHSTDVYTMTSDGWAIIRTGGWYTPTTSSRVRALLPGRWNVSFNHGLYFGGHLITPYTDGLAVHEASGAVGFAGANDSPGVILTAEDVAAIVTASEAKAETRAAKRAERITREHPAPRPVTWRADVIHGAYGWQSPMPSPHRGYRASAECSSCQAESAEYREARQAVMTADHPNGHAYSVTVGDAVLSAPAGACPWDCPLRTASTGARGY